MPVHHPSPPPPPLLPPPPQSLVLRLQQALISCATVRRFCLSSLLFSIYTYSRVSTSIYVNIQSVESGDFSQSDSSISELVDFLNSVDESSEKEAFQVLTEIYRYLTLPSLDQVLSCNERFTFCFFVLIHLLHLSLILGSFSFLVFFVGWIEDGYGCTFV